MPSGLPAEAQREWRRIVPTLDDLGLLAALDRGVLIRHCVAWAEWLQLGDLVAQSGRLIKGREGTLVRNPLLLQRKDAAETLDRLAVQLGLTPIARLRSGILPEVSEPEGIPPGVAALNEYRKRMEAS